MLHIINKKNTVFDSTFFREEMRIIYQTSLFADVYHII